ncbi:hypothetical protein [Rhizobium rhizogenes]|uniref:hypothetical protein n=1 Tax=Rhizobium rhizogenes TaxID=359 RepID=UPI001574ABE3|nr:hypothetical protein [Rhizobium rhizogenes]NTF46078.1 hypothetical protein [Rhizobium rhizogenes]
MAIEGSKLSPNDATTIEFKRAGFPWQQIFLSFGEPALDGMPEMELKTIVPLAFFFHK